MIEPADLPELEPWSKPSPGSDRKGNNRPRLSGVTTVDATGAATVIVGRPPAGYSWFVERGSFVVPGTAAGTILWLVFVGQVQDDMLEDSSGDIAVGAANRTVRAVGEWSPRIYVPSASNLIAVVSGATAAGQARFTCRVEEAPN